MGALSWSVNDPELGVLERLGLAGLYMTLDVAPVGQLGELSWELTAEQVSLSWPDEVTDQDAIMPLMEFAWQALEPTFKDEGGLGVFYWPGVHTQGKRDDFRQRLPDHMGLYGTFMQHPRTHPRTKGVVTAVIEIDERPYIFTYKEPKSLLRYVEAAKELFAKKTQAFKHEVTFSNYLVPGSTKRFGDEQSWAGPGQQALLLLFMPLACLYVQLSPSRDWVVVAPDVRDLKRYALQRRGFSAPHEPMPYAGSAVDAALTAMLHLELTRELNRLEKWQTKAQCEVFQIGGVAWNEQNVRHALERVSLDSERYELCREVVHLFPNSPRPRNKKKPEDEEQYFIAVSRPRALILENLLRGDYWYKALFEVPRVHRDSMEKASKTGESAQRAWFRLLGFDRQALREMMELITKEMADDPKVARDNAFTAAFHEALRLLYAREYELVSKRGGTRQASERLSDLREDIYRKLTRASTRSLFRQVMADYFSRAGLVNQVKTLQTHRQQIWAFIDDAHQWSRAKDLALLSLATYTKAEADEASPEDDHASGESVDV